MSKYPKVSIITVTYNAELHIEDTFKSVDEQDYPNKEYILVDGKSGDGTLSILFTYKYMVDEYLIERDAGIYDAMNKGMKMATGEYIIFMNAGDLFVNKHSLSNIMKNTDGEDFIYGISVYKTRSHKMRPWHKVTPPAHELEALSFIDGMVICHQCMIVKKSLAPEFDVLGYEVSADLDWSIKIMKKVKTKYFYDEETFVYYLDDGFSANNKKLAAKERFKICKKHFGFWPTFIHQFKIAIGVIKRGSLS